MDGTYGRLPGVDFNQTAFSLGFRIFPQEKDASYFFLFPSAGALDIGMGSTHIEANHTHATASYGEAMDSVHFHPGLRKNALSIERELVQDRLSQLIDRPVSDELVFDAVMDQRKGALPGLVSTVSFLGGGEFGRTIDDTPIASRQMSHTLVDLILEIWPNNFSAALQRTPPSVTPRHVKRAVDYINAHPENITSVDELAKICCVSVRSLQYGFREFTGASIGHYERRVRLEAARRAMIENPSLTVTQVARLWNFSNIHRFSQQFRNAFGVSPNEFQQKNRDSARRQT